MYFLLRLFLASLFFLSASLALAAEALVISSHPRLLLTPAEKSRLLAKKNADDPSWQALKARAHTLTTYSIFPYKYNRRSEEPDNTIFYDYLGEGWFYAAMPLALAYQMTGDTQYSDKLLQLADEMMRAQSDPDNNPPNGLPPLQPGNYYPTRYLGPVLAIIYDWCYDQLGSTRKAQMIALMNTYFDDMRANAYQRNDHADGNYFPSHLYAAGYLGYASSGDNPRAPEMIDYARLRFDGTSSPLVAPGNVPDDHFDQVFAGGYKPAIARDFNGPNITTAPFKGGFNVQGWAYTTGTLNRIINYLLAVKSATNEDLFAPHLSWFSQVLRGEKHSLLPNHFEIDPWGEWGGDQGPVIPRSLPARLAYVLAGTPDGPGAQHFAYSEIADSTYPGVTVYPLSEWEDFFFTDLKRPSAELTLPPYYTGLGPVYPQAGATNGALPYFIMRSGWGPNATWASIFMGAAWYDDHQHKNAGHLEIKRGNDYLLVDASQWMGLAGSIGILCCPGQNEAGNASSANTLYFNDFGDFQHTGEMQYTGGQGNWGKDEVIADEQNDSYSYIRSDLSTAYNRSGDPDDQVDRKLEYFYRSFLYLRSANLFVVYDQVKAKNSTNPRGQYRKHLRWHFPNVPTISGQTVRVDQGASRLYLDTLLPASASIVAVDESHNPDPCDGSDPACIPDGEPANSGTWRVEVKDSANPLFSPFLTVLQPGTTSTPQMATSNLTALDAKMIGTQIVQPGGETNLVFFNNQSGQVPSPITATSYSFSGPASARHTLCGFLPSASYTVTFSGGKVEVVQSSSGNVTTSPGGVLHFRLDSAGGGTFGNWTPLPGGGTTLAGPAVVIFDGAPQVFVRGTDNRIYRDLLTTGGWSGWSEVSGGGFTPSGPGATVFNNTLYLFVRGTNSRIYQNLLTANGWSGWSEVPGGSFTPSGPGAAVFNNTLYLFVRGTDNRIYQNRLTAGGWSGWSEVPGGGATPAGPAAAVFQNFLYLTVQGTDNHIYDNLLTSGGWTGWAAVPGNLLTPSGPAAAVFNGELWYFVQGMEDRIYRNRLPASATSDWTGWVEVPGGGFTPSGPGAAVTASTLYLAVRGTDNGIYLNQGTLP